MNRIDRQGAAICPLCDRQTPPPHPHAEMAYHTSREGLTEKRDLNDLEERLEGVLERLKASESPDS